MHTCSYSTVVISRFPKYRNSKQAETKSTNYYPPRGPSHLLETNLIIESFAALYELRIQTRRLPSFSFEMEGGGSGTGSKELASKHCYWDRRSFRPGHSPLRLKSNDDDHPAIIVLNSSSSQCRQQPTSPAVAVRQAASIIQYVGRAGRTS